tara:strand:- start:36 stop:560 length:525 start_codon:yes stop_codon:yes gene_type:complete
MHILGLSLVLFAVACEDNNDGSEEDGHTDADGFILEANGTEIYREFKGSTSGSVTLKVGGDLDLSVHFLDEDGKEIEHEEEEKDDHDHDHGDEEELKVSGFNASIATIEFHEDDGHNHRKISLNLKGQEEDEHAMMLEVKGVGAGTTSFKLELMHGDHADYTSTKNVPVVVTAN